MCGRVTETDPSRIARELGISGEPELEMGPRYNIAPSELVPVVRVLDPSGARRLHLLRWGLVPHFAKDPSIGNRLVNARMESVMDKPVFRDAFQRRRCLVVVDGFYEWQKIGRLRQPFHIRSQSGELLVMAGLWERNVTGDGEILETFTIITKPADASVMSIHDRMPAILNRQDFDAWLDTGRAPDALLALLSAPSPVLATQPVSTLVNKPANDVPACLDPVPVQPSLFD